LINIWFGNYFSEIGKLDTALYHYQILFSIGESLKDSSLIAKGYVSEAIIYSELQQIERAKEKFQLGMEIFRLRGDTRNLAAATNGLGVALARQEKYDKAVEYLMEGKQLMAEIGHELGVQNTNYNIASIYLLRDVPLSAQPFAYEYLAFAKGKQDSINMAAGYNIIGKVFRGLKEYDKAISYLDSALMIIEKRVLKSMKYEVLSDLTAIQEDKKDYRAALATYKRYYDAKQDYLDEQTQKNIAELEIKYETARNEKKLLANEKAIIELEQTAQIRKQRSWLIGVGLITSLLFSILLYYKYKSDTQKKEIEAARLQSQLMNKQSDLTNLALDIKRKNQFSNELIERLNQLQKTNPNEIKFALKEINSFAINHLQISEDLELLQSNVDKVNRAFYEKLEKNFGELTANEKYLAGLIRLNLSNKDVAAIRGISTSSAKMSRHRLRKKLQLSPDQDIVGFLQKF
ncbi:MAG: hypothetical protein AAF985_19645, partial [Bacteroidota bacterium]